MRLFRAGLYVSLMLASLCVCASGQAAPTATPQCTDPYSAARDGANPLMLAAAPGANPLRGANFFVNGPAHGAAAGAIARMLGIDAASPPGSELSAFSEQESWSQFQQAYVDRVASGASAPNGLNDLEKIAAEPEVQRVSSYSEGGSAAGIYSQTEKLFCHNFLADPGSVPIINTYFLHASLGGCPTAAQIRAGTAIFRARVDAVAQAAGNRAVVFLLETDGIGSSRCMAKQGDLGEWLSLVRYEVDTLGGLPHAVAYVEAGYSDANSPVYTAQALKAVDVKRIRGFYTNDTHLNWTINEVRWGEKVVHRLAGGTHFIVNTAQNGNGPLVPANRSRNGNEVLCNPPGRGLGPKPTTATGFAEVDAFMWTSVPGNSSGSCNGGTPSGTFWATRAIELAQNANGRLGPHDPSEPY